VSFCEEMLRNENSLAKNSPAETQRIQQLGHLDEVYIELSFNLNKIHSSLKTVLIRHLGGRSRSCFFLNKSKEINNERQKIWFWLSVPFQLQLKVCLLETVGLLQFTKESSCSIGGEPWFLWPEKYYKCCPPKHTINI